MAGKSTVVGRERGLFVSSFFPVYLTLVGLGFLALFNASVLRSLICVGDIRWV
jgi:hypothetical protein